MTVGDWITLGHDMAAVIAVVTGAVIAIVGVYLATCAVRLLWQRVAAFHRRGIARVRAARAVPEDCGCTVYAEDGRVTWITCPHHKPPGRHHPDVAVITATRQQIDEWRREL